MQAKLAWDRQPDLWCWQTATETLLAIGVDQPTGADAARAAALICQLNGGQSRRYAGKNQILVPAKNRRFRSVRLRHRRADSIRRSSRPSATVLFHRLFMKPA